MVPVFGLILCFDRMNPVSGRLLWPGFSAAISQRLEGMVAGFLDKIMRQTGIKAGGGYVLRHQALWRPNSKMARIL